MADPADTPPVDIDDTHPEQPPSRPARSSTTRPPTTRPPAPRPRRKRPPSEAQRHWLTRGASEPGGKLPLFDLEGRRVSKRVVEACIAAGWAERWFANPLKPDWLVCRLTEAGRVTVAESPEADVAPDVAPEHAERKDAKKATRKPSSSPDVAEAEERDDGTGDLFALR